MSGDKTGSIRIFFDLCNFFIESNFAAILVILPISSSISIVFVLRAALLARWTISGILFSNFVALHLKQE